MKKQQVLITGVSGFVGSHMVDFLLNKGNVDIHGLDIAGGGKSDNLKSSCGRIEFHVCDINDRKDVKKVIKAVNPDKIFHLAGQAFVRDSWEGPYQTLSTNIFGQLNIFEAVRELEINPWIQVACSSEEYGLALSDELPINEKSDLRPLSPYAVSKIGQDFLAYQYFKSYKMSIVRTRAFNQIGPRQNDSFATSNFAKQIALIEIGKQKPVLKVGNLDAIRDFTDVRDMVEAYWRSTEKCVAGDVYNLCSGKGYKMSDILNILLSFSKKNIKVEKDQNRMRPSDVPVWVGDYSKFKRETGWEPVRTIEESLRDILEYWRTKVK